MPATINVHSHTKPLDIVLLYTPGHLGSAIVLNKLLRMNCYRVVAIVKSPISTTQRNKAIEKMGVIMSAVLAWQSIVQGICYLLSVLFSRFGSHLLPCWYLARRHKIPVLTINRINAKSTVSMLQGYKPDLLISAYYNKILKSDILDIPRLGAINIHPGALPNYKGAMVYFWAIKNNEPRAAVSVHMMNESIDEGDLLACKSFPIKKYYTQQTVLIRTALIGSHLLKRLGKKIVNTGRIVKIPQEKSKAEACYYSVPGFNDYSNYIKSHRFLGFEIFFHFFVRNYYESNHTPYFVFFDEYCFCPS